MSGPILLATLVLLASEEAIASGSSHVEAVSGPVRITLDTPSISFSDDGDEGRFHTSWRVEAQPVAERALGVATAVVASWTKRERRQLAPWTSELRLAQSWADPAEAWSLEAAPGPVSYSSPLGVPNAPPMTIAMLELAFAEPPPREVADELMSRILGAVAVELTGTE